MLPKELSIAEFMRLVKTNSSKWYREKHNPKFNWQVGYGAFTVSKSSLDSVYQYIAAQKEHHAKMPFEDELKALLSKHGMEYLGD
jgi:REP element-mobilizing transposase RayT